MAGARMGRFSPPTQQYGAPLSAIHPADGNIGTTVSNSNSGGGGAPSTTTTTQSQGNAASYASAQQTEEFYSLLGQLNPLL